MLSKLTSGRPPHELTYIDSLFNLAGAGVPNISGPEAVAFFKKSSLEVVSRTRPYFLTSVLWIIVSVAPDLVSSKCIQE